MKITHRAPADASALSLTVVAEPSLALLNASDKAPRLSCCCRLSELMPLVRQAHDAARAARVATESKPNVAA